MTFAIVPDNTKPGAYLESVKGCSYIIHVASPIATFPGNLEAQAIAGNKAILEAAEATPSVKRVVITGSVAATRPYERLFREHPANQAVMSGKGDEVPPITAETRVPTQPPAPDSATGFLRYENSKIAAINLIDEYVAAHKTKGIHFSIVNLLPGWVLGPEELTRNKQEAFKGSNFILGWLFEELKVGPLWGLPEDEVLWHLSETVHLDDVVESHVKALDTDKVPGNYRSFLLCSDSPNGPVLMDAADIVRRELPQEVADGKIPFAGRLGGIPVWTAGFRSERLTSRCCRNHAEQIRCNAHGARPTWTSFPALCQSGQRHHQVVCSSERLSRGRIGGSFLGMVPTDTVFRMHSCYFIFEIHSWAFAASKMYMGIPRKSDIGIYNFPPRYTNHHFPPTLGRTSRKSPVLRPLAASYLGISTVKSAPV